MNIENEVFKRTNVNFKQLEKYGFKKEKNNYIFEKKILNNEKQRIYLANQDEKQIDFLNSKEFMVVTLHNLLQNELINKEIETHNIAEPDSIVLSKISKEQYFYTNNKFDIEKFHKLLEQYKITEYDFIKMSKENRKAIRKNGKGIKKQPHKKCEFL